MDEQLHELAAQYERHRAAAVKMQHEMSSLTGTATSANGLVTAVVGARGELRQLAFESRRYRDLAPAELAHTIVATVDQARGNVFRQLAADLPAGLTGGVSAADLLAGNVDVSALLPENLLIDPGGYAGWTPPNRHGGAETQRS